MYRFITGICVVLMLFMFSSISETHAQGKKKIRLSLSASVTQRLGVDTDIKVDYSRPGVKGRKIWGGLVPYGMAPGDKESHNNPFPWRAGANENTTIEFNHDLMIEGHKLPAGKYGLFMMPSEKNWTIIFSKKNDQWGSFSYDKQYDALRVDVTPVKAPHEEWLTYGFDDLNGTSATLFLRWAELKVPIKIELAEK